MGHSSPAEPVDFYIFDNVLKCFYHIFERADWKIAKLPYDQLKSTVNEAYQACNASIPEIPNLPTEADKAAMVRSLEWGAEPPSDPLRYQLQLYFDPKYEDASFISCFNERITNWIDHYNAEKESHNLQIMIGVFVAVAVVTIACCVGFALYQKYADQQRRENMMRGGLFSEARNEQDCDESRSAAHAPSFHHDPNAYELESVGERSSLLINS